MYSRLELVIVMMALIVRISDQVVVVSNSSSYHHNGYRKDCTNEAIGTHHADSKGIYIGLFKYMNAH